MQNKSDKSTLVAIHQLVELFSNSKYLVALTGAGLSTESGLADFRGPNGVWTRREKALPPIATPSLDSVKPNIGHFALVKLFKIKKLKFLISQNVDNLHIRSGFPYDSLAELHGNYNLFKCMSCDLRYTMQEIQWDKSIYGFGFRKDPPHLDQPFCPNCKGRLISSIINFGDPIPEKELKLAFYHAKKADIFLVIGSSLVVQPAALLPLECHKKGGNIVIINKGQTSLDHLATIKINDSAGEILDMIVTLLLNDKLSEPSFNK